MEMTRRTVQALKAPDPLDSGTSSGGSEHECDLRAAAAALLGPDPSAVAFDQALGDRQTQPGALAVPVAGLVPAPEPVEHRAGGAQGHSDE
jgi:hypothetical protein